MATYVISDIHGNYDMFSDLLEKIRLTDEDRLYILGDVIDRGPYPVRTMLKIMEMPNAVCIKGNHEVMAEGCLEVFMKEPGNLQNLMLNEDLLNKIIVWQYNGCDTTLEEFSRLSFEKQQSVLEFIKKMAVYQKVEVSGKDYLLVHGGLGGFSPEKPMEEYTIDELVWERPEYSTCYYPDTYVVTGHTPTHLITINPKSGYIFQGNNHIAIDCGSCLPLVK